MNTPKPLSEGETAQARKTTDKAGQALSWVAGFIALPWLKLKGKTQFSRGVKEWSIAADGTFTFNPEWLAATRPEERVFSLAHGAMRFLLRHHDRGVDLGIVDPKTGAAPEGKEHEHKLWGEASAAVVNAPLAADKIGRVPEGAVMPPSDYQGSLDAESLYQHLLKVRPPPPPGGGQSPNPQSGEQPSPPSGGQPTPPPEGGQQQADPNAQSGSSDQAQGGQGEAPMSPDDIDQMRREVEALAQQAGQGSHVCNALRPKVSRSNFRAVIGAGMSDANTEASERTTKTYSRASRREGLLEGLVLPGTIGTDPSICVVLDASGSVSRELLAKCAGHCVKIATEYPNVRLRLITHTDRVEFDEWIKPGGDVKRIMEATGHTGGTDFAPAYDAARRVAPRGKFDALVHFTDGYNFRPWPMPPAKRLVVGLCGRESMESGVSGSNSAPPVRAKVIPVTEGEGRS